MNNYKFYISRYIGNVWEEDTDIESAFSGLHYAKCDGLSSHGKIKNIYTESYAETDELRVYLPENVARENTDIEFEFVFIGKDRRDTYHSFVEWLSGHRLKYWDTCRNREVEMVLIDSISPSTDELYGSQPFIRCKFKFKNIKGETIKKSRI